MSSSTVFVTVSVSQDFPAPNGLASIQFADLADQLYQVVLQDAGGNTIAAQTISTVTPVSPEVPSGPEAAPAAQEPVTPPETATVAPVDATPTPTA